MVTVAIDDSLTGSKAIVHCALFHAVIDRTLCPHLPLCWQSHLKLCTCSKYISLMFEGLIPQFNALFKVGGPFMEIGRDGG